MPFFKMVGIRRRRREVCYTVLAVCFLAFLVINFLKIFEHQTALERLTNRHIRIVSRNPPTNKGQKLDQIQHLDIDLSVFRTSLESRANQAEFRSFLDGGKYPCFYEEDEQEFLAPLLGLKPATDDKRRGKSRNIK